MLGSRCEVIQWLNFDLPSPTGLYGNLFETSSLNPTATPMQWCWRGLCCILQMSFDCWMTPVKEKFGLLLQGKSSNVAGASPLWPMQADRPGKGVWIGWALPSLNPTLPGPNSAFPTPISSLFCSPPPHSTACVGLTYCGPPDIHWHTGSLWPSWWQHAHFMAALHQILLAEYAFCWCCSSKGLGHKSIVLINSYLEFRILKRWHSCLLLVIDDVENGWSQLLVSLTIKA